MSDLAVQNRESEQEVMPSFDFLLERETERNTLLAEHRAWLKEIKRERPLPKTHYRVAVYIRYFNQTRYEDYLSAHKKQFLDTLALCPNWKFVGFYVDEGSTAPNMENAPEWSRLLQDCYEEKVNLIITQKASNISKKLSSSLSVRASWQHSQSQWAFTSFRRIFIRWLPITRRIYTTPTFCQIPVGRYSLMTNPGGKCCMIDKSTRKQLAERKERVRRRINTKVDPENYEFIPAKKPIDYYDNDIRQRVAVYARVSTDNVQQTSSYELQKEIL